MSEKPNTDSIFCTAVEIESTEERDEYLQRVCGDDPELMQQVQRLLDGHFQGGSILDSPPLGLGVTVDQPISERPGTQIGPYKLLQRIGEGGMGVVYMAEQKEPVKRRVALKIIKPGMDTRQVIARFEAERQALAMMDHPNIAKVLDAGQTDSGRPYFVMELVKGVPVTQYCDEQHLTPKERLELFASICQAVQHAHHKGIIHRDLKPSNVLVALFDGQPVCKVIDFGVAKATNQTLTEKTMFTQLGQVVGTLEYMSPEQAQVNQLDVDTRSDIYSLGVLLYELLTGDTPFDRQRLRSAAFDEMLRIIREEEPPRPSTKLSSSETLPSIAANRHVDPQRLTSSIRGELDWIVMKALEKDRARRYETASKFAEDVQHYLNDEPVVACPPSVWYLLRKRIRKHRTATAFTSLLLLALLAVAVSGFVVAQGVRESAQRERELAQRRSTLNRDLGSTLASAEGLTGQLGGTFWEDRPLLDRARDALHHAEALGRSELSGPQLKGRVAELRTLIEQKDADTRLQEGFHDLMLLPYNARFVGLDKNPYVDFWPHYDRYLSVAGLDLATITPALAEQKLQDRSQEARATIIAALYAHQSLFPWDFDNYTRLHSLQTRAFDVLDAIDSDLWRRRFRNILRRLRRSATADGVAPRELLELAESVDLAAQPSPVLIWMSSLLRQLKRHDSSLTLLQRGFAHHPRDYFLAVTLAERYREEANRLTGAAAKLADAGDEKQSLLQRAKVCRAESIRYASVAVALYPQSNQLRSVLATSLKFDGRTAEVTELYRQAARLEAGPETHHALGAWYYQAGDYQAAISECRQALMFQSDHSDAIRLMAKCYRALDMPEKELQVLQDAAPLCRSPDLHYELFLKHASRGNHAAAMEALLRAKQLFLADGGGPLWFFNDHAAFAFFGEGVYRDAFDVYRANKIRRFPELAEEEDELQQGFRLQFTGFYLGRSRNFAGSYRRAHGRPLCEWLIREFPDDPLNYVYLAKFVREDDPELASRLCRQALESAPQKTQRGWAHLEIGDILARQRQRERAVDEYRKILEIPMPQDNAFEMGTYVNLLHWTAQDLRNLDDLDTAWRAQQLCAQAAERCPMRDDLGVEWPNGLLPMIYLQLGLLHAERGQLDDAIGAFERAAQVEIAPSPVRNGWVLWARDAANCWLGHLLRKKGELERAHQSFQHARRCWRHPQMAGTVTDIAWRLATHADPELRVPDQAVRLAQQAVDMLNPSTDANTARNCWSNLGVALCRDGRPEEAVEAMEKADGMVEGGDLAHRMFLAMAHWQLGHRERACKLFAEGAAWIDAKRRFHREHHRFREEAEMLISVEVLEEFYDQQVAQQPADAESHLRRAGWYARHQRFDAAAKDYLQVLDLSTVPPARQRSNRWWGPQRHMAMDLAERPEIDVRLQQLRPDDQRLWVGRLRLHAAHNRFREAEAILERLLQQDPDYHFALLLMATLKFRRGDVAGYVGICDELLNDSRKDSANARQRTVRICLLTPDLMRDRREQVLSMADEVVSNASERTQDAPWFWLAGGLAAYRAGQLDTARERLQQALKGEELCQAAADFVLSMVEHRAGNSRTAREHYYNGYGRATPAWGSRSRAFRWQEVLMMKALRHEAAGLLGIVEYDVPVAILRKASRHGREESSGTSLTK